MSSVRRSLVIDVRKAFDSGIGTYVRNVVPPVCRSLGIVPTLLVSHGSAQEHAAYLQGLPARLVEVKARAFGPEEQIELRRVLDRSSLFWATSLAHPLYTRRPLVATVHDVAQLVLGPEGGVGPVTREASRVFLHSLKTRARALLFNSRFTQAEFLRRVGEPGAAALTVTPLGVDDVWAQATPGTRDGTRAPYFLSVGNVRPHKNLGRLIAAFSEIADRVPHDLVLIGQSEGFRTSDHQTVEALRKLGNRARFLGHVPDAELRAAVASADAMVLPSLYEGFGLPALEAMSAGCPVIASEAAALPEVCGDAARYFDPHSVPSIAQRLLEHVAAPAETRSRFVELGRARAGVFRWERTAELTSQALSRCLEEPGVP